jgi:AGCS family alanine or glycine:cation symporter
MGPKWKWLSVMFCMLTLMAAFGIGNMTQVNTIAASINNAIDTFGGNSMAHSFVLFGQKIPVTSVIVGVIVAVLTGLLLLGGIKRIGAVTEKMIPFMAGVYIVCALAVVLTNLKSLGGVFAMIFQGAFQPQAIMGGTAGTVLKTTIQKGVGRGVFSNEAGLGSAPIAHAASSETNPVKQGLYGIFEVFMDTIVICTLTAVTLLCGVKYGIAITWGQDAGSELISAAFGTVFGAKLGALIVAVGISLFALSTIFGWSLYSTRACEFLLGRKAVPVFQIVFVLAVVVGATLKLQVAWDIADTLNGFMAIPNLIALLGLSGVVIRLTNEHFSKKTNE